VTESVIGNIKRTSCLAFTALPHEAIDWREAVFVLKLRLAIVRQGSEYLVTAGMGV
jgi:hypothetical protein